MIPLSPSDSMFPFVITLFFTSSRACLSQPNLHHLIFISSLFIEKSGRLTDSPHLREEKRMWDSSSVLLCFSILSWWFRTRLGWLLYWNVSLFALTFHCSFCSCCWFPLISLFDLSEGRERENEDQTQSRRTELMSAKSVGWFTSIRSFFFSSPTPPLPSLSPWSSVLSPVL